MYLSDQIQKDAYEKIIKLAQQIIDADEREDDIAVALKCREILQLLSDSNQDDVENKIYSKFSSICDDLDGIPLEKSVRKLWDQDDLVKLDEDVSDIIRTHKRTLINSCVELVEREG